MQKSDIIHGKGDKLEIGIDCVDLSQFSRDVISKRNILEKIFTENEIKYCERKVKSHQHYAVRFAGKEAVIKAFSYYGIRLLLKQIEIANKKNGIPFVKIVDVNVDDFDVKISLSHSKETAVAVALVVKKSEN